MKRLLILPIILLSGCATNQYKTINVSQNNIEASQVYDAQNNTLLSKKSNVVAVRFPQVFKENSDKLNFSVYVQNNINKTFLFSPDYIRVKFHYSDDIKTYKPYSIEELEVAEYNKHSLAVFGMAFVTGMQNMNAGHSHEEGTFTFSGTQRMTTNNYIYHTYNVRGHGEYSLDIYDSQLAAHETASNNKALTDFVGSKYQSVQNAISNLSSNYLKTKEVPPNYFYGGMVLVDNESKRASSIEVLVDVGSELHRFIFSMDNTRSTNSL